MVRELTADEVEFDIELLPEDASIEGNACAHDGCEECHAWSRDQLDRGNEWAWCTVRVVAKWEGYEGDDYLSCCSYESEKAFKTPGGYFDDMKAEALKDLNNVIAQHAGKLRPLMA